MYQRLTRQFKNCLPEKKKKNFMFRRHVILLHLCILNKNIDQIIMLSHIMFTEFTITVLVQQSIFEKLPYSNYGKAH